MDPDDVEFSQSELQPSSIGFVVLESQPDTVSDNVDVMQQWPALVPQQTNEDEQILSSPTIQGSKNKKQIHGLASDVSEDEQRKKDPVILVTDSEYEGPEKGKVENVNISSEVEEVVSESEEQGEVTVIDNDKKDKETEKKQENCESDNGGSSFHSSGRENLGSYNQAELSQDHCTGNRFNVFGSLSQQDIFSDEENDGDVSTPSECFGNLQLSNQPMIVPETVDESDCYIPPSQDCYGPAPVIIPSSPTDGSFQDLTSDDQDRTVYNPSDMATLAEDIPYTSKPKKREEDEEKSDSSTKEQKQTDSNKSNSSSESSVYEVGKTSTLASDQEHVMLPQSLNLHFTETQLSASNAGDNGQLPSAGRLSQAKESTSFPATYNNNKQEVDVITITNTAEDDEVGESQQLSLRLTPTQSEKSQNPTEKSSKIGKEENVASLIRSNNGITTMKSQEIKSGNRQHNEHAKFLSQPAVMTGSAAHFGGKFSSTNTDSNSVEFHLSLPEEGKLLHPITEVSPPVLSSKLSKVMSRGDSQEPGPSHAMSYYKGTSRGDSQEPGPSHAMSYYKGTSRGDSQEPGPSHAMSYYKGTSRGDSQEPGPSHAMSYYKGTSQGDSQEPGPSHAMSYYKGTSRGDSQEPGPSHAMSYYKGTSRGDSQEPGPSHAMSYYKGTSRGDSQEPGPSHAMSYYKDIEDNHTQKTAIQGKTPSLVIGMISTPTEMSDPLFQLEKPEVQEESIGMSEDPKLDVFRRTKSTNRASPRKKVIEEDSDEEIIIRPPDKKRRQLIGSDTEDIDGDTQPDLPTKVHDGSQQPSVPPQVTKSSQSMPHKIWSISSESSQQASTQTLQKKTSVSGESSQKALTRTLQKKTSVSSGSSQQASTRTLQKKTSVSSEAGYLGSVDDDSLEILVHSQQQTVHNIIDSEQDKNDQITDSVMLVDTESYEPMETTANALILSDIPNDSKHSEHIIVSQGSPGNQLCDVSVRGETVQEISKQLSGNEQNQAWLNTRTRSAGEAFQPKNVNVLPVRDNKTSGIRETESPALASRVSPSHSVLEFSLKGNLDPQNDGVASSKMTKETSDPFAFHSTQSQRISPNSAGQRSKVSNPTKTPQQSILQTPVSSRKKRKSLTHRRLGLRTKRKDKHQGHVSFESPVAKSMSTPPHTPKDSPTLTQDKSVKRSNGVQATLSRAATTAVEKLDVTSVRQRNLTELASPHGVISLSTPQLSSAQQTTLLRSPAQDRSALFKVPSSGQGHTINIPDIYTPVLERESSSFDQSPGMTHGTKGDVTMFTVKTVEVKTEICEVYRNGVMVEKTEKEVQTENVKIYRNGKLIKENVNKSYKDPVITNLTPDGTEAQSASPVSLSPSRTTSTLTSGDLADISSLSKSSGSTRGSGPSPTRSNSNIDASVDKTTAETGVLRKSASLDVNIGQHNQSVTVATSRTGASLDSAIADLPSAQDKSTDHEFFTPPEQIHKPVAGLRRTPEIQQKSPAVRRRSQEIVQEKDSQKLAVTQKQTPRRKRSLDPGQVSSAATSRDNTIASDFENSPNEASSINKTGSGVESRFVLSVEGRRSSESLFTTSPEAPRAEVIEDENTKSASCKSEQKGTSSSSDEITCAQKVTRTSGADDGGNIGHNSSEQKSRSSASSDISPEVPFQDVPVESAISEREQGGGVVRSDPVFGARVMAKWKDGFFYPGTITKVESSRFQVKFDDGDTRFVKQAELLLVECLPIGQSIMVQSDDGYFDTGIITNLSRKGGVVQYMVEKDSGQTGEFRYSQVILSEDQAVCLIDDTRCTITSPNRPIGEAKLADVTLENLVEGKRRKGSRYEQKDVTLIHEKQDKRLAEEPGEELKVPSSRGKKRKLSAIEPQATSTPTPKEKGKRKKIRGGDTTAMFGDIVESPIGPRRSPRKTRVGLFEKEKAPMPSSAELFRGIVFLLTHVLKSEEQKKDEELFLQDSSSLEGSTDESAAEDDVSIPFDKDVIRAQIEAGGGIYLEQYNEKTIKTANRCLLISDSYQRTIKYFQCLASAIPCISHLWISDSCIQGRRLEYKSYTLQAGISLQKKKIMEWSDKRGHLLGLTVMVVAAQAKFKDEWTSVLEIAGCNVVSRIPSNRSGEPSINVIVTDKSCPARVLSQSKQHNIPVVSSEWVIQSLINGQRMPYSGHPRYRYDFFNK